MRPKLFYVHPPSVFPEFGVTVESLEELERYVLAYFPVHMPRLQWSEERIARLWNGEVMVDAQPWHATTIYCLTLTGGSTVCPQCGRLVTEIWHKGQARPWCLQQWCPPHGGIYEPEDTE